MGIRKMLNSISLATGLGSEEDRIRSVDNEAVTAARATQGGDAAVGSRRPSLPTTNPELLERFIRGIPRSQEHRPAPRRADQDGLVLDSEVTESYLRPNAIVRPPHGPLHSHATGGYDVQPDIPPMLQPGLAQPANGHSGEVEVIADQATLMPLAIVPVGEEVDDDTGYLAPRASGSVVAELPCSIDDILNAIGTRRPQLLILLTVFLAQGHNACQVLGPSLLIFSIYNEWPWVAMSRSASSMIFIVTGIGWFLGDMLLISMADVYGRLRLLIFALSFSVIFSLLSSVAQNFWVFVLLRFLSTACSAIVPHVSAIWSSEMMTMWARAAAVMVMLLGGSVAVPVASVANHFITESNQTAWRLSIWMLNLSGIGALILLVSYKFESPRFLATIRGDRRAAWKMLGKLCPGGIPVLVQLLNCNGHSSPLVPFHGTSAPTPNLPKGLWGAMRSSLRNFYSVAMNEQFRRTTLMLTTSWASHAMAYWGYEFYIPYYTDEIGAPWWISVLVFASEIVGEFISLPLTQFCGRIPALTFLGIAGAIAPMFLAISLWSAVPVLQLFLWKTILLVLWVMAGTAIWPVLFTITPESYPTSMRAGAASVNGVMSSIGMMLGSFLSTSTVKLASTSKMAWVHPAVFGGIRLIQVIISLHIEFEPLGKPLAETAGGSSFFDSRASPLLGSSYYEGRRVDRVLSSDEYSIRIQATQLDEDGCSASSNCELGDHRRSFAIKDTQSHREISLA